MIIHQQEDTRLNVWIVIMFIKLEKNVFQLALYVERNQVILKDLYFLY